MSDTSGPPAERWVGRGGRQKQMPVYVKADATM
jgi:hypothetical protein